MSEFDLAEPIKTYPQSSPSVGANPPLESNYVYDQIQGWQGSTIKSLKPPADEETLVHKDLEYGEFWRHIPAYAEIDMDTFLSHGWQMKKSILRPKQLRKVLGNLVDEEFYEDVEAGYRRAPMALRLSPYIVSLINWEDPYNCPIRAQFLTVRKKLMPDHPKLHLDTLDEQGDSPVPGLVHRYMDKALFLPLDTCPVYCRFCTRSYAIGLDTESVEKVNFSADYIRWKDAFSYIASRPELEDIVISGGDSFNLLPKQIEAIGFTLLSMPNIRRIRIATKGLAVVPQKIISHKDWLEAVTRITDYGRKRGKDVVIHSHFNHANEITWITEKACQILFERGIKVRSQSVLQRGVNDTPSEMINLVKRLGHINVQPYYVYICDMVKGVEDLRTSIDTAVQIEKHVRGSTAGFNTPTFVCDAPGGGGKRSIHSYDHYNKETGIAVYSAPSVKPGRQFLYFDPLHSLSKEAQIRWTNPREQEQMVATAMAAAAS